MAGGRGKRSGVHGLGGLVERLEQRGPEPVYLFVGDDRRALDQAVDAVRERVVAPDTAAFCEARLRGAECRVDEVLEACATLPLLGDRRLVVLREPEKLAQGLEALAAYAAAPSPSTCLVLVPAGLDRRLKTVKALEEAACTVVFEPPAGAELTGWIRSELKARSLAASPEALALLVDLVEADTLLLGHELEKLSLYCAHRGRIEREDVEAVLGRTRAIDVWDLTNAIEDGRPGPALAALRRLLGQGAAVPMLVGVLDWCLGRLLASEEPKAPPGRRRALTERRKDLVRRAGPVFSRLREADRLFRTTGGDAGAALERAVLLAATPGGGRPD